MVESGLDIDENDIVDDDELDDDVEEVEDDWTPPTKEEYEKLLAGKQKADSEAAARKRWMREAGLDPKTGKPVAKREVKLDFNADTTDDEDETDESASDNARAMAAAVKQQKADIARSQRELQRQLEREVAKTEQSERARAAVLIAAVPAALNDAGFNGRNMERMLRLMDLDAVEIDSDGEIEGLTEQVEELKKDFPEFFKRSRMKDAAEKVADTKTVSGSKKAAPASEENLDFATRLRNQLYRGK